MGAHVAQALANAQAQRVLLERQRLLKELELAKKIQHLFLPSRLPTISGLGLAARMISSRQVGGDYYDAVPMENGQTLLLLADVSGKGVAAALVMSNLQAALWATADLGFGLGEWAAHLNDVLFHRLEGSRYVTAFLLLLERDGRHGTYVNAGHPPALVAGGDGSQRLDSTGTPLGMLPGQRYETGSVELGEGSALLLYSDGLTEAADESGEELGVEGLEKILADVAGEPAEPAATRILEAVERFGGADQDRDDRTLVLLRCVSRTKA